MTVVKIKMVKCKIVECFNINCIPVKTLSAVAENIVYLIKF